MNALEYLRKLGVKGFLFTYRWMAVFILWGGSVSIIGFFLFMGVYLTNHSWIAPTIISPTNDKILDLTAKLVTSEQTLATLTSDRDHQTLSIASLQKSISDLYKMDDKFRTVINAQGKSDTEDVPQLNALNADKAKDNERTHSLLIQLDEAEKQVDADLQAGLVTRMDAINTKSSINQIRSAFTDSRVTEVLLQDSAKQKSSSLTLVNALAQEAELRTGIMQFEILVKTGEAQIASDNAQIAELNQALAVAKTSPYFMATKGKVQFAFVPYDSQDSAKIGAPVYDCYLNFIACRQVGTVSQIFSDEEMVTHPIFHTEVRGFLVQLNLTRQASAKSQTLFIGSKPLGI